MNMKTTDVTPVELHDGMYYKREDCFSRPSGANGSKLRACFHLAERAKAAGALTIVSAQSVLSPQAVISATVAQELGMRHISVVGGTTPDKAVKNISIRKAQELGSTVLALAPVGYNPAIQKAAKELVDGDPTHTHWQLPYGISCPDSYGLDAVRDFVEVGAAQVANVPDSVTRIVLPFGSGNTAAGVLYGLQEIGWDGVVELMTVGPDKRAWLNDRLAQLEMSPSFRVNQHYLHPTFATYGDRMKETIDGIEMHPTYEGKVVRYLNHREMVGLEDWWGDRDESVLFWIVGGPLR